MAVEKFRLGDLLLKKGLITEVQLKVAFEEQKVKNKRLGEILVDLGYIDERKLIEILAEQLNVKVIKANDVKITPDLQNIINESRALRLQVIPIKVEGNKLHIATTDPTNIIALDEVERTTNKELVVYIISKQDFLTLFSKIYSSEDKLYKIARNIEDKIF